MTRLVSHISDAAPFAAPLPLIRFGTDGVRGRVGAGAITPEALTRLGYAMAVASKPRRGASRGGGERLRVAMARDTRRSGPMVEAALTAGLAGGGADVVALGEAPSPALAHLAPALGVDLALAITASHNSAEDNGVKAFDGMGWKVSKAWEARVEAHVATAPDWVGGLGVGAYLTGPDTHGLYLDYLASALAEKATLAGMRVVLDSAHGAAYRAAPEAFARHGAQVVACLGDAPNGDNINAGVGATAPEALAAQVRASGADVGFALDGDGDRFVVCDERGQIIDGDALLGALATHWREQGALRGAGVVATEWSNTALDRYMAGMGLALTRAPVGDRNVVNAMRRRGINLGGERSGHVAFLDCARACDGLLGALLASSALVSSGMPASRFFARFALTPRLERAIALDTPSRLRAPVVASVVRAQRARLGDGGLLVARASGTEPKARLMAQGQNPDTLRCVLNEVADAIAYA